ncbi:MAG: heme exporter protein CcmD [Gammaproteobacteria bacterium]
MNIAEFFHMGGYGFYVWGSYAVALVVLSVNIVSALRNKQRVLHSLMRTKARNRSRT